MMKIYKEASGIRKRRVEGTERERDTKWGKRSVRRRKRKEKKRMVASVRYLEGDVSRWNGSDAVLYSAVVQSGTLADRWW